MSLIYDKCQESYKAENRLTAPMLGATGLQITGVNLAEAASSAESQFEAIKVGYERFKPDFISPFMNIMLEVTALGIKPNFGNNSFNFDFAAMSGFSKRKFLESSSIITYISTLKQMAINLPESIYKSAYITAPFTLATLIAGANSAKKCLQQNSSDLLELIEICSTWQKSLIDEIAKLEIDAIFLLDPYAGMLEVKEFATYAGKPLEELTNYIHNLGKDSLLHICGRAAKHLSGMVSTGVDGISLDSPEMEIELPKLINQVPKDVVLVGNINPTGYMQNGTPQQVYAEVQNLVFQLRNHPNFLLSTGCDLPADTPLKNIEAFIKAGRSTKI